MPVHKFKKTYLTDLSWILEGDLPQNILPSKKLMDILWDDHPKERPIIKVHGKEIACPRWNKSYLKDYSSSGHPHKYYLLLMGWANKNIRPACKTENEFNQILVNWYENGTNYIGAHSDDETQLHKHSPIVTISLGATRTFRIRPKRRGILPKEDEWLRKDFEIRNGSILVMGGNAQSQFTHEIVKIDKGMNVGKRISVTFRQFKE